MQPMGIAVSCEFHYHDSSWYCKYPFCLLSLLRLIAIWRWLPSPVVFPDFGVAMFARTICFIIIPRTLESESGGAAIGKNVPSGAAPGPPDLVLSRGRRGG